MDRRLVVLICSAAMLGLASAPATAQQKTAKQCNAEWTANKASIQASGKTKKAFVAECRGHATAAGAPTAPTTNPPRSSRSATRTQTGSVKTAKECSAEWNKATIQASGKTKKAFVAECRGQPAGTSTTTAAPPRAPSSAAPPTAGPTPSPPTRPSATAPRTREATR